jgi:uncharacterized repeat protein (TIGR03803 family)
MRAILMGLVVMTMVGFASPSFAWTETELCWFHGSPYYSSSHGSQPQGPLVADNAGNLYGATLKGGTSNLGEVFQLKPPTTVGLTCYERVLYYFTGGTDGALPNNITAAFSPTTHALTAIYGTTQQGGGNTPCRGGCGTVYRLTPGCGSQWCETVLYSFKGSADGGNPSRGVIAYKGSLYGPTYGGLQGVGSTVFKLTPSGGKWVETVLHSFTGYPDGDNATGALTLSGGNFYGTTFFGGANGLGTVYKLTPTGTETVLYSFTGGTDGATPYDSVVADHAGNLYGTTESGLQNGPAPFGTVYKLTPGCGTQWCLTVLHTFTGYPNDGAHPYYDLTPTFDPNTQALTAVYGMTSVGGNAGANCCGTIFRVSASGTETVLHSFASGTRDGAYPNAGLLFDRNIYGVTVGGGFIDGGTVFQLTQ